MIRKAAIRDVKAIHRILQIYGERGVLLPRPLSGLYDHLRDFWVYEDEESGAVAGCCALQFCWEDLAEVRSVAVHPDFIRQKIGTQLVNTAIEDAKAFGMQKVFTLTYKPHFFSNFGFNIIDRAELPLKIWGDCIVCVKFPDCDEIAMMLELK
jgi:amino-acid N-acetyltransferase